MQILVLTLRPTNIAPHSSFFQEETDLPGTLPTGAMFVGEGVKHKKKKSEEAAGVRRELPEAGARLGPEAPAGSGAARSALRTMPQILGSEGPCDICSPAKKRITFGGFNDGKPGGWAKKSSEVPTSLGNMRRI